MRPYKEGEYHSFKWRGWLDFGTGALGDMACHTTNMPVMALELWDPIAVTCLKNSGLVDNETYPAESTFKFEFGQRGDNNQLQPCHFYWYDGGSRKNLPPDRVISKLPAAFQKRVAAQKDGTGGNTSGSVILGTKGVIFSPDDYGARYYMLPKEDFKDYKPPAQTLPRIPFKGSGDQRQKWEFVSTIKGEYETGTMSNFGYAGRLTETILVGNLALSRTCWRADRMGRCKPSQHEC